MKKNKILLLVSLLSVMIQSFAQAQQSDLQNRYRIIVTTDFPPFPVTNSDPDDVQSIVRFLLYSNEFDVEGLIVSAGTFDMTAEKKNMLAVLDEYDKIDENLRIHDPNFPTADALRAITYEGKGNNNGVPIKWGCGKQEVSEIIGKGMDSEASEAIIAAVDSPDPRPLWISVWGGPRELAQAIWKVKNTRNEKELKVFVSKLRVFLIACQDASHEWLMSEYPELFIIDSRKTYQGIFGSDSKEWAEENIINNHGPLCAIYPPKAMGGPGVIEGDSPAFLHLVSAMRGINNPEDPSQPSWGGEYVKKEGTNHWLDGPGGATIKKWKNDYQKEFKERADWCLAPKFKEWLFDYVPKQYPNAVMKNHGGWLQAKPTENLVASWALWDEKGITLKDMEAHNLEKGEVIFIEKADKTDWVYNDAVTYYEGAGYLIDGYNPTTMGSWGAENCNVIQFDGEAKEFVELMVKAWQKVDQKEIKKSSEWPMATKFKEWLFDYVPKQYPNAVMKDHGGWLQAKPTENFVASWALWNDPGITLMDMEVHSLEKGEVIFIEKAIKTDWVYNDAVTYYEGAGYLIDGYNPATMGNWGAQNCNVIQFTGEAKEFVELMVKAWQKVDQKEIKKSSELPMAPKFKEWLFDYVPKQYPNAVMKDHGGWLQAKPTENLVASWALWNEKGITLKDMEAHNLEKGEVIFIEKADKTDWTNHKAVTFYEGAGYLIDGYDPATMGSWGAENCNVIQFTGEAKEFVELMVKAWQKAK